jgi:hypothetical protein
MNQTANESVAPQESHTGSWWNASVLRKREKLLMALSDAMQSGVQHLELVDVLRDFNGDYIGASRPYDTAAEEDENDKQNEEAISSARPLIRALIRSGMTISGLATYSVVTEDIEEVLRRLGRPEPVNGSISSQAECIFAELDQDRLEKATDSALIWDRDERRRVARTEIERQLVGLGGVTRKMPELRKNVVEVGLAGDGLAISSDAKAMLDLATGIVSGVEPIRWHDDDNHSESSIVICKETIPVTQIGSGEYCVRPELLAALKDAVHEDIIAGLKVQLADGSIHDGFIVWEGGADVARCKDLDGATRVAKALRLAGSLEHLWVTKGAEFENVCDDPKP